MASDTPGYFRIRISSVFPHRCLTFNLYVLINNRFVLYLRKGDQLTAEKISHLESKSADIFYVPELERAAFKAYVSEQMNSDELSTKQKAMILRESSFTLVEELFENPDVNQALTESRQIINSFVEFMDEAPEGMAHLIGLSSHDFYTYNHSLDVSIYSLGLGAVSGYSGEQLRELGVGALFHDIGKRHVDAAIICKNGPLDELEWEQMKKHPQYGLIILSENGEISDSIKACCFEHHENFLGNGYPQQLQGEEIHPMARIVAITDCYDAMTTKRSYSDPMRPVEALNLMKDKLQGRFDPDLLDAMYSALFQMESVNSD